MVKLSVNEEIINQRIIAAQLSNRTDAILTAMALAHAAKIDRVAPDLDKATNFPGALRWEFTEQIRQGEDRTPSRAEMDAHVAEQQAFYAAKDAQLRDICELIAKEQEFRRDGKVDRDIVL